MFLQRAILGTRLGQEESQEIKRMEYWNRIDASMVGWDKSIHRLWHSLLFWPHHLLLHGGPIYDVVICTTIWPEDWAPNLGFTWMYEDKRSPFSTLLGVFAWVPTWYLAIFSWAITNCKLFPALVADTKCGNQPVLNKRQHLLFLWRRLGISPKIKLTQWLKKKNHSKIIHWNHPMIKNWNHSEIIKGKSP